MDYDIVGSIKIKDGLFLGDEYAAQDLEFVVTNKVTRIINCAGKQIPNHWNTVGVQYLTYAWFETDTQVIFDQNDEVMLTTYKFIDEALNVGESVLVHSVKGHNRSVCIIASYMMKKFRWTLYKTLEFLHSRRPDLEIRAAFFNQLLALETRLTKLGFGAKTYNWKEVSDNKENELENEEVLLTNTFLNSKNQELAEYNNVEDKEVVQKITWIDQQDGKQNGQVQFSHAVIGGGPKRKQKNLNPLVLGLIPPYDQCNFKKNKYRNQTPQKVKSIVKGSNNVIDFKPPSEKNLERPSTGNFLGPRNSAGNTQINGMGPKGSKSMGKMSSQKDFNAQSNSNLSSTQNSSNKLNNNFFSSTRNQENENSNGVQSKKSGQGFKTTAFSSNNRNSNSANNLHDDAKLQNSLNNIANRQFREAFPQNQNYFDDQPQPQQQQMYGNSVQTINQRNKQQQSNVQKVYGQKMGFKNRKGSARLQQQGDGNRKAKPYSGYQNSNQRLYGNQNNNVSNFGSNNNIDYMFEDNSAQNGQYKSPQYNYEANFKNTQKIYSAPLGIVGRQTQVNNFLSGGPGGGGGGGKGNRHHYEMPSLSQPKNNYNHIMDHEKKVQKNIKKPNRPSTAPSKQKDNKSNQGPVNGFNMRGNFNKQQTAHQDLFITGTQRQKSASQKSGDEYGNKKMRCSSPGNFYQQNSYGKQTSKWKY